MTTQRSRRLRKKLRVDEFQEMGFDFSVELKQPLDESQADALVDAFLDEVVIPRGLEFGGWINGGFICKAGRGSATDADREAVANWFKARAEVSDASVSPLIDAWH
ncbi:hypothetical protein CK507_10940 [Pseudomonas sp. WN033]|nr:hypothetical protein CK507_10940 [Pseudomonas sp. WN033]